MPRPSSRWTFTASTVLAAAAIITGLGCGAGPKDPTPPSPEETTRVHAGDIAPEIEAELLDGSVFRLADHRGEVVVISFFATWCPPCREELPHVEAELWQRYREAGLAVVAIAREEPADVVRPFVEERGFTFPVAVDPDRTNYARYADAYIPRLVVVDRDGTILHHASGFEADEFAELVALVGTALAQGAAAAAAS